MKTLVYADTREQPSNVPEILKSLGARVIFEALTVGDYIAARDCAVERKTLKDFVSSIFQARIFDQARRLLEVYSKPLIIVEGNLTEIFEKTNIQSRSIWGGLLALMLDIGVPVLFARDRYETAEIIFTLAKREQTEKKKAPVVRPKRKMWTLEQRQLYALMGLPNIGPEIAKRLLKKYKTLRKVFAAPEHELRHIEGLGKKRAKKICELLDAIFEEK